MAFNFNIKQHLENFTKEGNIDYEKAQQDFQDQLNAFVAKNKPDLEKLKEELKPDATNEFIKSLNIEGVENDNQFKAYVKRLGASSTELTEQLTELEKQKSKYEKDIEDLQKQYSEVSTKNQRYERKSLIATKGFNNRYENAIILEAENRITDDVDFQSALDLVKKDYPEWVAKTQKIGKTPPNEPLNEDEETKRMRDLVGLK